MRSRALLIAALLIAVGGVVWLMSQKFAGSSASRADEESTTTTETPEAGMRAPALEGTGPAKVTAAPAGEQLEVTVVSADGGEPIVGASVIAVGKDGTKMATSDAKGRAIVKGLVDGLWTITAWHPQYCPSLLAGPSGISAGAGGAGLVAFNLLPGTPPEPVTVQLGTGRRIDGRVVDEAGRAVAGATIQIGSDRARRWLTREAGMSSGDVHRLMQIRSADDGTFVLSGIPGIVKTITLGASKEGYVARWSKKIDVDPQKGSTEVTLRLYMGAVATGRVTLPSGKPAVGASVHVYSTGDEADTSTWHMPDWKERYWVKTDEDGTYTIRDLPPSNVELTANWHEPFLEGTDRILESLQPGETRTGIDLEVPERFVLDVLVRGKHGKPLHREHIMVRESGEDADPDFEENDRTDEEGRVRYAMPSAGPYDVFWLAPGREDRVATSVTLPADELALTIDGSQWTDVRVRVRDPGGNLVPRYRSEIYSLAGDSELNQSIFESRERTIETTTAHRVRGPLPWWLRVWDATNDSNRALPAQELAVRVDTLPEDGVIEVTLHKIGVLRGRFVDKEGQGVAGVVLRLEARGKARGRDGITVECSEDGSFEYEPPVLKDGHWRVHPQVPAGYTRVEDYRFRPKIGNRRMILLPGGTISGRVILPPGYEIDSDRLIRVEWQDREEDPDAMDHVLWSGIDENGAFEVSGVPLDRDIWLMVNDYAAAKVGLLIPEAIEDLRAGAKGVVLELKAGADISGRVVLPAGQTYTNLVVSAAPMNETQTARSGKANKDGTFAIRGLTPGKYRLRLLGTPNDRGYCHLAEQIVEAGTQDLRLEAAKVGTARVRVNVPEEDSEDIARATLIARTKDGREIHAYGSVGTKWTELVGLRPGTTYNLELNHWSGHVGYAVGVRAGDEVTIDAVMGEMIQGAFTSNHWLEYHHLYARSGERMFGLSRYSLEFSGPVPPGVYDIVLIAPDGTETVLARGVKPGGEYLELKLK